MVRNELQGVVYATSECISQDIPGASSQEINAVLHLALSGQPMCSGPAFLGAEQAGSIQGLPLTCLLTVAFRDIHCALSKAKTCHVLMGLHVLCVCRSSRMRC